MKQEQIVMMTHITQQLEWSTIGCKLANEIYQQE